MKPASWRTTIWGVLALVVPLLNILMKWHNHQPITQTDLMVLLGAGAAGGGLAQAADHANLGK